MCFFFFFFLIAGARTEAILWPPLYDREKWMGTRSFVVFCDTGWVWVCGVTTYHQRIERRSDSGRVKFNFQRRKKKESNSLVEGTLLRQKFNKQAETRLLRSSISCWISGLPWTFHQSLFLDTRESKIKLNKEKKRKEKKYDFFFLYICACAVFRLLSG